MYIEKIQVVRRNNWQLGPVELGELAPGLTLLLGDNGAGKTTLLQTIADQAGERAVQLPQRFSLPGSATVQGLLTLFLGSAAKLGSKDQEAARDSASETSTPEDATSQADPVRALAAAVGLEDSLRERVRNLSGGMHRRLGVALTLAQRASVYLLDEPCAGLDQTQRGALAQHVRGLASGRPIVCSTHHPGDFLPGAQRVLFLSHGTLTFDGSAEDFLAPAGDGQVERAYEHWNR